MLCVALSLPGCMSIPRECCGEPYCVDTNFPNATTISVDYLTRCGDPTLTCNPQRFAQCSLSPTTGVCEQTGAISFAPSFPVTTPFRSKSCRTYLIQTSRIYSLISHIEGSEGESNYGSRAKMQRKKGGKRKNR